MRVKVGDKKVYVVRVYSEDADDYIMDKFAFIQISPDSYKLICLTTHNRWDDVEYKRDDIVDLEEYLQETIFTKFSISAESPYQ